MEHEIVYRYRHIVTAYVVMACVAMTSIVVANGGPRVMYSYGVILVCVVMAHIGMAYIVMDNGGPPVIYSSI